MATDRNKVVAGTYEGASINWDDSYGIAWVGKRQQDRLIIKQNVSAINKLNQSGGDTVRGAFWGGVVGAMIAQDIGGSVTVEIVWKNGQLSLVNLAKGAYEIILQSFYKDASSFIAKLGEEERKRVLRAKELEEQRRKMQAEWGALSEEEKEKRKRKRTGILLLMLLGMLVLLGALIALIVAIT